jgi:hypothetical protein
MPPHPPRNFAVLRGLLRGRPRNGVPMPTALGANARAREADVGFVLPFRPRVVGLFGLQSTSGLSAGAFLSRSGQGSPGDPVDDESPEVDTRAFNESMRDQREAQGGH